MQKRTNGVAIAIATWFGCGYFPVGPGTVGSAAAVLLAWLANRYWGFDGWQIGLAGLLMFAPAVWASSIAAESSGRKDPGLVVVDEVVGQWITLAGATAINTRALLLGFCLFRILDIWKPAPARRFEKLPGGLGIVADDAMAGVYGALVLYLAGWCNLY